MTTKSKEDINESGLQVGGDFFVTRKLHRDNEIEKLRTENERLRECVEFLLPANERMYCGDFWKGMDPTFYHTLTYEGDLVLKEKTESARELLKELDGEVIN